jgi:hypothetical protein
MTVIALVGVGVVQSVRSDDSTFSWQSIFTTVNPEVEFMTLTLAWVGMMCSTF